ncbi:hypothetical protein BYT27DRAFT_7263126 [Phlegmacium glaucopus]|nr:hypothetical protein BYT27DRAFT_7263126 [Phlegmacium glaucopus]
MALSLPGPTMFTFGQRLGIFLVIEAAFLSAASVTFILCFALYRRILYTWRRKATHWQQTSDATSSGLFLNLMVADLVQAIGNMPDIRWMAEGIVSPGSLCTGQAVLKQVGIVGVAMTSLAIALHTFTILVLRWRGPPKLPTYAIISIWAFVALVIGSANATHRDEVYYGPTGYWCWILPKYKAEQIVTEYLWVWLSGLSMIILYGIMFAVIRGWFIIDHGIHWYNKSYRGALNLESDDDKRIKAVANSMLYYPAVYIVCVFPNTLARWLAFSDANPPPYQFTLFANAIYGLSGMFNLILFLVTRPRVVVGPTLPKLATPNRPRGDSVWSSSPKMGRLSEYDYGVITTDFEKGIRTDSNVDPQSPSRTKNRPRTSYDSPIISQLATSSMRNPHYPGNPSISSIREVEEVSDMIWR